MKQRPGRPPLDDSDPSVPVTVSIPSRQLAAAESLARRERVSVQTWIRRVVRTATIDDEIKRKK